MGHIMQTFSRGGLWDIYNKFMYVRMHACTYARMYISITSICIYIYVELNPPNGDIMGIFYGRMGYNCS